MASASVNRLMDNARVRLPGALDTAIYAEFFSALDTFLRGTNVWQQTFDVEVDPTTDTRLANPDAYIFQFFPPAGAVSVRLLSTLDANGTPVPSRMDTPNYLFLDYSPSEVATYKVTVSLSVTDPVSRTGHPICPDWIIDTYQDTILDGILARMMSQAAKPYSSVTMASYHASAFKSGTGQARIEVNRGRVYRAQAWAFPSFK